MTVRPKDNTIGDDPQELGDPQRLWLFGNGI